MSRAAKYDSSSTPWVRHFLRALLRPDARTPLQQHGAAMIRGGAAATVSFRREGRQSHMKAECILIHGAPGSGTVKLGQEIRRARMYEASALHRSKPVIALFVDAKADKATLLGVRECRGICDVVIVATSEPDGFKAARLIFNCEIHISRRARK